MVVPTMETLPRVPDTHGDTVDEKLFSDLYIRTSWFDASIALDQIEKVSRHCYLPSLHISAFLLLSYIEADRSVCCSYLPQHAAAAIYTGPTTIDSTISYAPHMHVLY